MICLNDKSFNSAKINNKLNLYDTESASGLFVNCEMKNFVLE